MRKLPSFDKIQFEIQTILESFSQTDDPEAGISAEPTPEECRALDAYLDELGTQEAQKIDGLAQYLKYLKGKQEVIKTEADALRVKAARINNTIERIKDRYLSIMRGYGLKKVSGEIYSLRVQESESVEVKDANAVADEFCKIVTTRTPDKILIKNKIKAGEEVAGACIVKRPSLRIG